MEDRELYTTFGSRANGLRVLFFRGLWQRFRLANDVPNRPPSDPSSMSFFPLFRQEPGSQRRAVTGHCPAAAGGRLQPARRPGGPRQRMPSAAAGDRDGKSLVLRAGDQGRNSDPAFAAITEVGSRWVARVRRSGPVAYAATAVFQDHGSALQACATRYPARTHISPSAA
jgi:hypothetical protein